MKLYRHYLFFYILITAAMEEPPRLAQQIERRVIVIDDENDSLERQPGVVKITDVRKICKISKESKVAGIGKNNVKIASFDGSQENVLIPPSTIRIQEYGGFELSSLGITQQLAVYVVEKNTHCTQTQDKIGILDIKTGVYQQLLEGSSWIQRILYDAKTSRLIAVYPSSIQLWDLKSGQLTQTIQRNAQGFFAHEVIFSKPKGRIINVWNGQVEYYDTISGCITTIMNSFKPNLSAVFSFKENEIMVVSEASKKTRGNDPERNFFPIEDEKGHKTYFKSTEPTIRFLHLKNVWSDYVITSKDQDSIQDLCYLKKRDQLVSAELNQVKLYDIKSQVQKVIAKGNGLYRVISCNKYDALIIQRYKDAYIIDLNRFALPAVD